LNESAEAQTNHFLVPPQTNKMLSSVLGSDQLKKIEAFVKARAKVLAREKQDEMDELLNEVIY